MIYVLYATKVNVGGWTTFTRQLVDSIRQTGEEARIVRLGNNDEYFERPFGPEHSYRNITLETLLKEAKKFPIIIAALGKHYTEEAFKLIRAGAKVVCHDPAEPAFSMKLENPWVIRRSMLEYFPKATFIRHPYIRRVVEPKGKRTKAILNTSRVDFDKNTTMILDANRLGANIDIIGFENRLYSKFKILPNYPEYEQTSGYRRPKDIPAHEYLRTALAMVDLTDIKGDGGGTQYTFLEAWDAGAVPIIGAWWLRKKDDMVCAQNCLMATDAEQLALLCKKLRKYPEQQIVENGYKALKRHAPKIIVPQVMEWLNAR